VDKKSRIGDWEGHRVKPPKWLWRRIGDAIIGNGHCGVVAILVERKTQFAILAKSKTKQARSARKCIARGLAPHRGQVHAITYDNGLEFAGHQAMAQPFLPNLFCPPLFFL